MIKHKWLGVVAVLLMAATVIATVFAYMNPSMFDSIIGMPEPEYISAMDKTEIMNIQIIADEIEWADMLENATAEEYIPATIIINGTKMENVGIRPKGNSSLSMVAQDSTTDRFSFKIEFDHYITGQKWLGLDKLAVNNIQADATYMKEYLSYDIMSYIGVEAPLYTFADISINGETWGFYLAVECLEESYAQRVYGKNHGQLYKPESMGIRGEGRMNEVVEEMRTNRTETQGEEGQRRQGQMPSFDDMQVQGQMPSSDRSQEQRQAQGDNTPNMQGGGNRAGFGGGGGMFGGMSSDGISLQYIDDDVTSYSAIFDNSALKSTTRDHQRVVEALYKLSKGEDLENTVDVEATLRYFAAHTVVVNLDSYISNMAHNYYLYEKDGQLTILPWDYNLAFGGFQSGNASDIVNFPIDTPVSGVSLEDRPMLGKSLEVPEYLELYHKYLREIIDGYFNSGLFEETVDSLNATISPYVENDPSAFYDYEAYKTAFAEIRELLLLRAKSIEGQLNGTIPSTSDGQKADSSNLVDSSAINLSSLGSMMGGGGGGMGRGREQGGMAAMPDFDMETMSKIMEIIQSIDGNELSDEQLAQLKELAVTDEQIEQFQNMSFGNFNNSQAPRFENQRSNINPITDTNTWLPVVTSTLLLFAGFLFIVLFQRRRNV